MACRTQHSVDGAKFTPLKRVLDEISFEATDKGGEAIKIDAAYVQGRIGDLAKNADLSKFIL